jgi:simple sugar transport system permease protein
MTAGLGYIALATMIFGQWRPYRCFGAAVLFGAMTELGYYIQTYNTGLNSEFLILMPYLVTIGVVSGLVGRVRPPAADGVPYSRE